MVNSLYSTQFNTIDRAQNLYGKFLYFAKDQKVAGGPRFYNFSVQQFI